MNPEASGMTSVHAKGIANGLVCPLVAGLAHVRVWVRKGGFFPLFLSKLTYGSVGIPSDIILMIYTQYGSTQ